MHSQPGNFEKPAPGALDEAVSRLFDLSPDPLCIAGLDGYFKRVNPAFVQALGYPAQELQSRPFFEFLHPDDVERSRESYESAKRGEIPGDGYFVNRYRRRDGSYRRLAWRGRLQLERSLIYGFARDITEPERFDSEALAPCGTAPAPMPGELDPFFTLSLDLLCIAGLDGYFKRLNPAFTRLLGYSAEELMARPLIEFIHPEDRPATLGEIERQHHGEDVLRFENRYIHKDGTHCWVLWQAATSVERGLIYAVGHDITERRAARERLEQERGTLEALVRKRTETLERTMERLRGERERYSALVENTILGIVVHRDDRLLFVNDAFARMFGYATAQEVLHMGDLTRLFQKEEYERLREYRAAVLRGDPHPPFFQIQGVRKDATPVWLDKVTARINWEGEPALQATYLDITHAKSLEEQLLHAQRMESIGRLAGGIAHDFNNMLSVIVSYSGMLAERFPEGDPVREDIDQMRHAADRATALTRQLLTFSRRQVQHLEILDLNRVVRDTEKMLRRVIGEDIGLTTRLAERPGMVKADVSQLEQVIMNLVVNARDAMPQGGSLAIETANETLDENYAVQHLEIAPGPYVVLAVSDTGTGMDEQTRARIFEPFFTTKEKGKGTGLGLATVYGIVKQSGGDIHVYSELGRGTTFKVYLPRTSESRAGEPHASPELAALGGTETVLLAEDDAQVRKAARRILERGGYTVLESCSGAEALQLSALFSGPVQLLLTDVVMPQMGGRELADQLKSARPDLRVLFMSGYTDDAILNQGVLEGGTLLLQKPFASEVMLRKVREALDGKR